MSNYQKSKANTVPSPSSNQNSTPAKLTLHGQGLYILENLEATEELQQFQTCLRNWYLLHIRSLETEQLSDSLEDTNFFYLLLDDMFDTLIGNADDRKDKQCIVTMGVAIIDDSFSMVKLSLNQNKVCLRDCFLSFTRSFEFRFDNLTIQDHTFAYGAIAELIYAYIYHFDEKRLSTPEN